jgi:hypothetical protein
MKVVLLVGVLALVVPAAATAKELSAATVCGAKGCTTFQRPSIDIASGGDGVADPAPAAAPYHAVKLTVDEQGHHESWTVFYVPGADMVVFRDEVGRATFEQLNGDARAAFRRYTDGIVPYPAPTITDATVDGRHVADPQSYLSLFTERPVGESYPAAADFVPIVLHASRPSPWTDARYLMFSPSTGSLERGTRNVQLAPATVDAIVAGASLDDGSPGGGSAFDWPLVSGTLAVTVLLGLVTFLLVRRGRHPATA